eukprot:TRINITY_DN1234_c0_g2_i1.p1 TRINITY_DN1234_c0_g2~~TRINITY_DN1234_c0_g2_i1.p1  ORF type:complete len:412 (-),score=45.79 TRINITY_DN1234_c0_g2_i1:557-1792(-)
MSDAESGCGRCWPSSAQPLDCDLPLSPDQVKSWSEQGFLLLDGVVDKDLIEQCRTSARAALVRGGGEERLQGFGHLQFPYQAPQSALNNITLHPRIIACAKQRLRTESVRLTQSDTWLKVGRPRPSVGHWERFDNDDQRMHVDFPNHSLVVPPPWHLPEAVAMILYLDDQAVCGGATRIVPGQGPEDEAYAYPAICSTPGVGAFPFFNDRTLAEENMREHAPDVAEFRETLYRREKEAIFRVGTLLLYRHDLWHRGVPLNRDKERVTLQLLFKKPHCDWFGHWNPGWARWTYRPVAKTFSGTLPDAGWSDGQSSDTTSVNANHIMDSDAALKRRRCLNEAMSRPALAPWPQFISSLSVEQRGCLGFPMPGDPYWTAETFEAVRRRYEPVGMDLSPYSVGLPASKNKHGAVP